MRTKEFYDFMIERESIRLRRAAGKPGPWTEDPILAKYKFTNVKREHDRTSRLLREEFYAPNHDAPRDIILLNCAIARYFGTIEFMRAIGWQKSWNPERIRRIANARVEKGERVFTGAYIITNGNISGSKVDVVLDRFLADLWTHRRGVLTSAMNNGSWQECAERMSTVFGFGGTGFMVKETLLDTMYTDFWLGGGPVDRNTWTPVGPGSMRGAGRVMEAKGALGKGMTLEVCRALFADRKKHWPNKFVELELTDIQFQLCEFAKYEKVLSGKGRPRSLFKPTENPV